MNVADIRELYAYNRWANARALDIAATLTHDEQHRQLGTSYDSVLGTLVHILWAEWVWLGRWRPHAPGDLNPQSTSDLLELRQRWAAFESEQTRFVSKLVNNDLVRMISYENPPGTPWSYSLQHMLQHVVNHSTYHRGQLTSMFRTLGATPRPFDFLVYFDERAEAGH